jgi:hypothetical protein
LKTQSAMVSYQPHLFDACPVTAAVEELANADGEQRGAIFTRPEVADFILDLCGYTVDQPLHKMRLLEPSFGGGDFLFPAVERLLTAYRRNGGTSPASDLADAICGVELHHASCRDMKRALAGVLKMHGIGDADAASLCAAWLAQGDFLLMPHEGHFDFVVGNPPYVRQEMIPTALIAEYRARYATIFDRADLYIPFMERALGLLTKGGVLGFICADRWMKNRYGGPLRELIAANYHLRSYIDMVDTPAFTSDVIAYPGIFVIGNEPGDMTNVAHRPAITAPVLSALARRLTADGGNAADAARVVGVGSAPWIVHSAGNGDLIGRLESTYPTLEEAGCKVGIGVATGADKAFIGDFATLDVEDDRKLPLVTTRDIQSGVIVHRGLGVINPFADGGGLVALRDYPRLARYLETHRDAIAGRFVAMKSPDRWYRTIDRIYPDLVQRPKLLIPDIKGEAHIVYDEGRYYPHHNLYFITSETWDLIALQAVMLSHVTRLFVSSYSTKMRGGYLRFQAQYLRRLRVPHWQDVPSDIRSMLIAAGRRRDRAACDDAVAALYGLTVVERESLTLKEVA